MLCADAAEAAFLHHEIVVAGCYFKHGVTLPWMLADSDPACPCVVVDVGANIGVFACHLLRLAGAAKRPLHLVAVEPIPALAKILAANVERTLQGASPDPTFAAATTVAIEACGVGASPASSAPFTFYPEAPGESTRHPAERAEQQKRLLAAAAAAQLPVPTGLACLEPPQTVQRPVHTLHGLMRRHQLAHIDLLKLDCEGDEWQALCGLRDDDFRRIRQLVLEVHDVDGRLASVVACLHRHAFAVGITPQRSARSAAYATFVPDSLCLYLVYGWRSAGGGTA